MPTATPIFASLNAGEFSPLLGGRVDYQKYPKGLKLCENFIPLVQGPLTRRPGTYYVAEVKDSSKRTALVRFEFSTTQAYIIEFGDLYMRFYRNEAQITATAQNITNITQANPGVVTYSGSDTYANGDQVFVSGVVGMTQVNGRRFTVANVDTGANTFELSGVDTSAYTAYSSGGTVAEVYEVATPYTLADIFDSNGALRLKFAQSADVLYVAHPSYAPRKITRTGHTSWTISTISFTDGPYLPTNTTATTFGLSAASGSGITLTASGTTGVNGGAGFQTTDVGRIVRIKHSNLWGWGVITARASTTSVTITANRTFGATTATVDWRMGVWSDYTGYPAAVSFYGDRLNWGGCTSFPQRMDGSVVGDYENMEPTSFATGSTTDNTVIADDDAIAVTLNANDVNVIKAIGEDEQGLIVFTVGGEWIVRPSNQNEALTPTNIRATRSTAWGTSEPQPVRVGKPHIFVQRAGRKVRELAYVFADDGFKSPDLTIASEHITAGGVVAIAYQAQPQTIVWFVRADGVLLGMTYDREQEAIAWHKHILGGSFGSGDAVVESIAVIPNSTGTADQLWLIVKRTINGSTKRYVEYMTPIWSDTIDPEDAHFVDCGLRYSGSAVGTFSGLSHLEAQTVTILADGSEVPTRTVASGAITLANSVTAETAIIGLGYESNMQTERLELQIGGGTIQGKKKRLTEVTVRFWQTLGGKAGPNADDLDPIVFNTSSDPMDSAPPLVDDDMDVSWAGGYETEGRIYIRQDQPYPMTVLAIIPEMWVDA